MLFFNIGSSFNDKHSKYVAEIHERYIQFELLSWGHFLSLTMKRLILTDSPSNDF